MTPALRAVPALLLLVAGCGKDEVVDPPPGETVVPQALFVARSGSLVSFDVATGAERPGTVQSVTSPSDMAVLEDGTLLLNLQGRNEVLAVDGRTMLERARMPSSTLGGTRPVHGYLTPTHGGRRYWMALNDGDGQNRASNSARFFDATLGSATFLQPVGEVALGMGHHKAAFSATSPRAVISNMSECEDVLSVFDFSDPASVQKLLTVSAAQLAPGASCSAALPSPHGCATAGGRSYCNLTGSGGIASFDLEATPPTFHVLSTQGKGAGYTRASPDGRWVYSLQNEPREGKGGEVGQFGQLVVIDAQADQVVTQLPLMYRNEDEQVALAGTDEAGASPGHMVLSNDGRPLWVTPAGPFGNTSARVRRELVLDVSNPLAPTQVGSLQVGASTGHHGEVLTPDGAHLFVTNNVDGTLSHIDTATRTVVRTLPVGAAPQQVVTWGSAEGSSSLGSH